MAAVPGKVSGGGVSTPDGMLHTQVWHREDDGNAFGAAENEFAVPSLQVGRHQRQSLGT